MSIINIGENYKNIVRWVLFVFVQMLCIYLVNKIEYGRGGIGNSVVNFIRLEFFLIILIQLWLFQILKKNIKSLVFLTLINIVFYVIVNEFYINFKRIPKISEISEVPELLEVLSLQHLLVFIGFSLFYLVFFIRQFEFSKKRVATFLIVAFGVFYLFKWHSHFYIKMYDTLGFEYQAADSKLGARTNGYLNFILFEEAKRNDAMKKLNQLEIQFSKFSPPDEANLNKRNVHLIVLESFFDPHMFENLTFSQSPIHETFQDLYEHQHISKSPVYGGGTAQAEFELLTGTPALGKYANIEFNLFTGNLVNDALASKLNQLGYTTVATNAMTPDIFNAQKAYESLGFEQQYYISGNTYLSKKEGDRFLYDGDLLGQNIQFVKEFIQKDSTQLLFNYVLGIYGHSPNTMDPERHPENLQVFLDDQKIPNEKFKRSINQIYYRTLSLSKYVSQLKEVDPDALIVIVGDHLPSISDIDLYGYKDPGLTKVPFYIIKDSEPFQLEPKEYHHYMISNMILDDILGIETTSTQNLENRYDEIIYQAIQSKNNH